jgi:hypothetical protein
MNTNVGSPQSPLVRIYRGRVAWGILGPFDSHILYGIVIEMGGSVGWATRLGITLVASFSNVRESGFVLRNPGV